MLKKWIILFPLAISASSNFTVGIARYSSSWQTQEGLYSGTNANLTQVLTSAAGPLALVSFTYSAIDYNNPPPTTGALGAVLFQKSSPTSAVIYNSSNTLSNFNQTALSGYTAVTFVETMGSTERLVNLMLNTQTGSFNSQSQIIIPYRSVSLTQIQSAAVYGSTFVTNALSGSLLLNQWGSLKGFPQTPANPLDIFTSPLFIATASTSDSATTAFTQNSYGVINTAYFKQINTQCSLPVRLSDTAQQEVYFLSYSPSAKLLFWGDDSLFGTRLAACKFNAQGNFSAPHYLIRPYSFLSGPSALTTDPANNLYLLWNGSSNLYAGVYKITQNSWQTLSIAPTSFYNSASLPLITSFASGLFLTQITPSSFSYNLSCSVLNNTNFTFSAPVTFNQTLTGIVTSFFAPPSCASTVDTHGNIVSVYSGSSASGYQIFYNVYNPTSSVFFGQMTLNVDAPTAISAPLLLNSSNQIAAVWSENLSGTYTIFAASYNPTSASFNAPVSLFTGFTAEPQLLPLSNQLGFVFTGTP